MGNGRSTMQELDFEDLAMYWLAEKRGNPVGKMVIRWNRFAKDTVGKPLVLSTDRSCANLARDRGKWSDKENCQWIRLAPGSLDETPSWLKFA